MNDPCYCVKKKYCTLGKHEWKLRDLLVNYKTTVPHTLMIVVLDEELVVDNGGSGHFSDVFWR